MGNAVTFRCQRGRRWRIVNYAQPGITLPKRNYGFEKRQKELAKAEKKKLKAERRAERAADQPSEDSEQDQPPTEPTRDE